MTQNQTPPPLPQGDEDFTALARMAIISVVLSAAVAFAMNLVDPDLWGHVCYGQDAILAGALPETATHTFTTPDHPWINHEILAELLFAVGFDTLGVPGMLIAKCLWGLSILGLMAWVARRHGVSWLCFWGLMLLVAPTLGAFFPMRPQVLSFMCCALMLGVLDLAFKSNRGEQAGAVRWAPLFLLPIIVAVWVNSHGGFLAGLAIALTYLAGRGLEGLLRGYPGAWLRAARLAGVGVATVAATLANPYGFELHRWIVTSLACPRPEITEWEPTKTTDPVFVPLVLLVLLAGLGLKFTKLRRDWVELVIFALVVVQAVIHVRHIAFVALLAGVWLPPHVQSVAETLRRRTGPGLAEIRLAPWMKWSAIAALWVAMTVQAYELGGRLVELPVQRNMYPVDCIEFMAERGVEGKLMVSFNWAQYALMALPKCPVAFDGRYDTCYPQEVVDMHFDFLLGENGGRRYRSAKSGPVDGQRVFEFGGPELAMIDRQCKLARENMQRAIQAQSAQPRWVLLYQDKLAELWGRTEVYDNPSSDRYLPPDRRIVGEHYSTTSRPWPALPRAPANVTATPVARNQQQPSTDQAG